MNYYYRNIGDYLKDTAHLSLLEHGCYTRLLDVYYSTESPLEDDQVLRLVGARTKEEKTAIKNILLEFFQKVGTEWIQKRCDEEIEIYQRKAGISRENGLKGGRPKNPAGSSEKPSGLFLGSEKKPTDNPFPLSTPTPTPAPTKDTMVPEPVLDAVVAELVLLTGKAFDPNAKYCGGLRARIAEGATLEVLLGVVRAKHSQWAEDPKMSRYIHPETLFRPENFEKYILEVTPSGEMKKPETFLEKSTREFNEEFARAQRA